MRMHMLKAPCQVRKDPCFLGVMTLHPYKLAVLVILERPSGGAFSEY